ncbi:hypothetical protein R1sor_000576 [Riccia sorocarpa]|uniref:Uncharacterized protein n=1 Tax=Riccia sorocarpa TaxID=122646 RepID=A0ABD3GXH8_9MARC
MGELESIAKQDLCTGKAGHFDGVCGSVQEVEDSLLVHSIVGGETNMASKSKRVNSKPDGKTDRYVLKESDYELIVSYLEEPDNFAALFGSGGKTKIGGKHQTKTTALAVMAVVVSWTGQTPEAQRFLDRNPSRHDTVQLQSLGFPPCSAQNLYKKVLRYRSRYESALSILKEIGSGLTDEDIARGITLEAKLNKACPFFYRMDALFGTKSNMVPPATCELGIPRVPAVQMISEDEGSDKEDLTCLEDPKSVKKKFFTSSRGLSLLASSVNNLVARAVTVLLTSPQAPSSARPAV